jgi:hypothetical protein
MFLCEILTEQQQALPTTVVKPSAQHVHVHVEQPKPSKSSSTPHKEKKETPPVQAQQGQQPVPQASTQADPNSPGGYGNEYDPELDGEVVEEVPPFQEILPMKRYYLIGRLKEIKSRLDQCNIQNSDFDIIMKFINNLSYDSLVSLSSGIIPVVEDQLARLTTNAQ